MCWAHGDMASRFSRRSTQDEGPLRNGQDGRVMSARSERGMVRITLQGEGHAGKELCIVL